MIRILAWCLALGVALWCGAWVYGKRAIRGGVNDQIALLREQGIEASYKSLEIGGFPFGYAGRVIEPKAGVTVSSVTYHWAAPWMEVETFASDPGALTFSVPESQTLTLAPFDGGPPLEIKIRSQELQGRVAQIEGRALLEGRAKSLHVDVVPRPGLEGQPLTLVLSGLTFTGEGPKIEDRAPFEPGFAASVSAVEANFLSKITDRPQIVAEASAATFTMRMAGTRADADIVAEASAVAVDGPLPVVLTTKAVAARVAGPAVVLHEAEPLAVSLDIQEADPGATLWHLLDPAGAFPHEIARVRVDAEADVVLAAPLADLAALMEAEVPLAVENITIKSLDVDAAGLEIAGDGAATVVAGQPEGTATLRLGGMEGFIANAVKAGLMPEEQATVYALMLKNFGREGETPGQKIFKLIMRDGITFVNGLPIGSAPTLPQ